MHTRNSSKGMNLKPIHDLELHLRTFAKTFFENLLEPERMRIFPLKLQYQNVISDCFKNKSVEAYEFHLISNSNVRYIL